jgi:hypothetical protein
MGQVQFSVHLEGGKTDIDPVQISYNVEKKKEGDESERDTPDDPPLQRICRTNSLHAIY